MWRVKRNARRTAAHGGGGVNAINFTRFITIIMHVHSTTETNPVPVNAAAAAASSLFVARVDRLINQVHVSKYVKIICKGAQWTAAAGPQAQEEGVIGGSIGLLVTGLTVFKI